MNDTVTAAQGVLAGHCTDASARTGVTALIFPRGARGAAFLPGSAPGTRELATLESWHLVEHAHGVCLAGGSAFGLAAADGVVAVLAERGIGHSTPHGVVPIVPAAILYDLHTASDRPRASHGRAAAEAASVDPLPAGRVGAGTGARVGGLWGGLGPGGIGTAAAPGIGVVVAVNAAGRITTTLGAPVDDPAPWPSLGAGQNTTLAVVVAEAQLTKGQAARLARMAAAGLARVTCPAFTPFDGDVVFAFGTGARGAIDEVALTRLGDDAATAVAAAVSRVDPGPPWVTLGPDREVRTGLINPSVQIFRVRRDRGPGDLACHRRGPQWITAVDGRPFGMWLAPPGPAPVAPAWIEVPPAHTIGLAVGTWHRGPVPLEPDDREGAYVSFEAPRTGRDDHHAHPWPA